MAEHPLQACVGSGDTVVASSAVLKEESVTVEDRADDGDTDSEHDDVHPEQAGRHKSVESQRQTPQRSSYRILGTHHPQRLQQQEEDDHGEDEDDPMAWADLEAFGGTKKTLEKKKPVRKMTPEEVREQLQELDEIEHRMLEAHHEKKSKKGMIDTIAWLKKHNEHVDASRDVNHKMKRSSSFVRSLLNVFSLGSRGRNNSRHEDPPRSNNSYSEHSNSVFDEEYEHFPKLATPWGQKESSCTWSEVGFGILNQTILEDMRRVRAVVSSGALASATPQALVAVAKWLTLFDQHVHDVITLKEYLLEERAVIAGVGYRVTTVYDTYSEALATALEKVHDDRRYLGDAIIATFNELEAVLREEVAAVQDVISQSLTEEQEYEALSNLFHHLSEEEGCGVIVAKLLGWMKTNFDEQDTKAFLDLFDNDAQDKIAGEWMRQYASYLHLLDEFSANSDTSMTFYT